MIDPINEDELRQLGRIKQYQQYQNHLDELDKPDKKKDSTSTGEIQGKKVKKIESDISSVGKVFSNLKKNY